MKLYLVRDSWAVASGTSQMARWDGALGLVDTGIIYTGPGIGSVVDGDEVRFQRVGSLFTVTKNGAAAFTCTDATRFGGTPGIATFNRADATIVQASFGWKFIEAGNM